jgi:hypothetical protein
MALSVRSIPSMFDALSAMSFSIIYCLLIPYETFVVPYGRDSSRAFAMRRGRCSVSCSQAIDRRMGAVKEKRNFILKLS